VAAYLDCALPVDAFWTSIDSAGRGPIAGARMKRRGVKRGLPDILVIWHNTIWIELKSKAGRLSVEQKAFRDLVVIAGAGYAVCRSTDEVEWALLRFGIPLRARVAA
jgi:hypothetical protein